ncbi:MAG: JAB domain-containing protein [Bacteroidia bacterium]
MKNQHNIREIQIQYTRPQVKEMPKVVKSMEAATLFRLFADPERIDYKEFFWVMLLSQAAHVLGIGEISVGTTVATAVNTKEIFQLALKGNATNVIIGHNHPSGNRLPSSHDIALTKDIVSFGKMIGITINDHIIITSEGYYSFADNGLL